MSARDARYEDTSEWSNALLPCSTRINQREAGLRKDGKKRRSTSENGSEYRCELVASPSKRRIGVWGWRAEGRGRETRADAQPLSSASPGRNASPARFFQSPVSALVKRPNIHAISTSSMRHCRRPLLQRGRQGRSAGCRDAVPPSRPFRL